MLLWRYTLKSEHMSKYLENGLIAQAILMHTFYCAIK